jgi:hypothetical protein
MRAALRDRPVARFVFLAVFFGGFTLVANTVLGSDVSVVARVVGSVIGGLIFATLMASASRYTDSEA